jgi:hypothetical protein
MKFALLPLHVHGLSERGCAELLLRTGIVEYEYVGLACGLIRLQLLLSRRLLDDDFVCFVASIRLVRQQRSHTNEYAHLSMLWWRCCRQRQHH